MYTISYTFEGVVFLTPKQQQAIKDRLTENGYPHLLEDKGHCQLLSITMPDNDLSHAFIVGMLVEVVRQKNQEKPVVGS